MLRYLYFFFVLLLVPLFSAVVEGAVPSQPEENLSVSIVRSRRGMVRQWINTSGFIVPQALVKVNSLTEGYIFGDLSEVGFSVKEKEILCTLHNKLSGFDLERKKAVLEVRESLLNKLELSAEKETILAVALAERDYIVAQSDLGSTRLAYEGKKALGVSGMLAGQELQLAKAEYEKAKANAEFLNSVREVRQSELKNKIWLMDLQRVRAERDGAKVDLDGSRYLQTLLTVTAPVTGIVVKRLVERGDWVTTGRELFQIADVSSMHCNCFLDERSIIGLKPGQKVELIHFDNGTSYEGRVEIVSPAIDPEKGGHLVRIVIHNPDERILIGGYLSCRILVLEKTGIVTLPMKSVLSDEGSSYVYIVTDENKVVKQPVQTGIVEEGQVEIISGLAPGKSVVVDGVYNVKDGLEVTVTLEVE
jgi:RND family efflux transporter MFP subunit